MKKLLEILSAIPAPSGREADIRDAVTSHLSALPVLTDAHGTLLAHKEGTGNGILVLCALDTPCLYVTYAEDGFARFSPVGGLTVSEGTVVRFGDGAFGVIGKDADGLFIDTGSKKAETGDFATPLPSFYPIGDSLVAGFAMGSRALITSAICAANAPTEKDVWFAFAAKTAIRQLSPSFLKLVSVEKLISLEVSRANDAPAEKTVFASLGKGCAVRVKDENMLAHPDMLPFLEGTPYPTFREVSTRRGIGGVVQKAYGGLRSGALGLPTRYPDTTGETVSLADVENMAHILSSLLN